MKFLTPGRLIVSFPKSRQSGQGGKFFSETFCKTLSIRALQSVRDCAISAPITLF